MLDDGPDQERWAARRRSPDEPRLAVPPQWNGRFVILDPLPKRSYSGEESHDDPKYKLDLSPTFSCGLVFFDLKRKNAI